MLFVRLSLTAFLNFSFLVGEFSISFLLSVGCLVGDTNEACYGLHNIVFEIIINLRPKEFHLTKKK